MSIDDRARLISGKVPDVFVDLWLYPSESGGRRGAIGPGYGCMCSPEHPDAMVEGWDGWPQLGDAWMQPGETRRVGYVFLSGPRAVAAVCGGERFFLYEGRKAVGEALIIRD